MENPRKQPKKRFRPLAAQFTLLVTFSLSLNSAHSAVTATPELNTPPTENKTLAQVEEKSKFRIATFTEFMMPSIGNNGQVPSPGSSLGNPYTFTWAYIDFDLGSKSMPALTDWKVVYWQRFFVFFNSPVDFLPRNPRFAIRKTNVFKAPGLGTTLDLYVQPGTSPEGFNSKGRSVEFGFRTNTSYAFPKSKFTVGMVSEFTVSRAFNGKPENDFYGWILPWMTYDISKTFFTQNSANVGIAHTPGDPLFKLGWDIPNPMIQNGIGMNLSSKASVVLLLNNYLIEAPMLKNTWASLWLNLTFL